MNLNFVYETRQIKVGDSVTLISDIKLGSDYGIMKEFNIDSTIKSEIGKMSTLMYVYDVKLEEGYCKVQTKKGTQGIKFERDYPIELFKIVKVPKMNDIVSWLYNNQEVIYPEEWTLFKSDIEFISRFIVKIFQTNLKAIYLINKYNNHLYNNYNPIEVLMFYKTLIQQMGLSFYQRYDAFNAQTKRKDFIKAIQEIDSTWHTNDCISLYNLNNLGILSRDGSPYINNADRLAKYLDPHKQIVNEKTKGSEFENLKKIIIENEKINAQLKTANDKRFIKELSQDIIDELELTIFNVKTLPGRNQVLYIFIDKYNNKRFYISDFLFEFYVSGYTNIIDNDYIMPLDEKVHRKFFIRDMDVLKTLKFAVNDNHKRFMKLGKF